MNRTLGLITAGILALGVTQANAAPITRVVMKVSDLATTAGGIVDPYLDWVNAGGVNEGVVGATSLTNNGIDLKDSWIDSNWGTIDSVRVAMHRDGQEVAFLEFDSAGTTKTDFFDLSNLTSSSWGTTGFPGQDLVNPYFTGQWFNIEGSPSNDRHWYVNNNWGGCGADRGWFVVMDGTTAPGYICSWEDNGVSAVGSNSRGFMYSTFQDVPDPDHQNFNDATIGIADVFSVSVTYDDGETTGGGTVPVPGTVLLLIPGLMGFAAMRRRRTNA